MRSASPLVAAGGIGQRNRALLEQLHRLPAAFTVSEAAQALDLSPAAAARLLVYLARRGWLARVRRGLYVAVPLEARRSGEWLEDPWVVAERVFSPCYVGGWSACAHWGLTDQVFRTLLVVTSRRVRHRDVVMQGLPFHVTVRSTQAIFGTEPVWRGSTRTLVSDPSRTVVDVLDDPSIGGGLRTVADVLFEYFQNEHRNDDLLVEYGDRLGNGAVFKRLGFLVERSGIETPELVAACLQRRTAGLVALDPSAGGAGRIVRRWGLRTNVALGDVGGDG